MASARTDHRGYFIDLEQVPHQGWRVGAITHRVNGRALSPPAFSYPDRETAAQYGRPQHHLRPFERAPATSAVHLKADIRLHANIRPGGPCADLCNAANYCPGLLGSPSLCEAVAPLAQAPYITFAVAPSCSAISHVSPLSPQSKRAIPPSWPPMMFSIMRVPHPRCVGGTMVGPPDSVQRKLNCPSAVEDHTISTSPSAADSDPYFAALVASSCNEIAIA
jgi:hypothetical protein